MSEESSKTKKVDIRRIALITILVNTIILIPLVAVILANVAGIAVFITTIVFFGILIVTSFVAIIFDIILLRQNKKNLEKKDE